MPAPSLLFFFVIERSVLMALVFYNKGMFEKVTMPIFNIERTQLNAAHVQLLKKLRRIVFAETNRFLTIQSLEFQEMWQKHSLRTPRMISHEKPEF